MSSMNIISSVAVSPVVAVSVPVPVVSSSSYFVNNYFFENIESDEITTIKKRLKFNLFNFSFIPFDISKKNNEGDTENFYKKLIELKPENKGFIKTSIYERLEKILNTLIQRYNKLFKNYNINIEDDDIYINLDFINFIDWEEEEEFIIYDSFKCFICLEDEGEKNTVLRYCKNKHNEKICLSCYRDLFKNSNSNKCPLCRENIYNKEEIKIEEINEENEEKREQQNDLINKLKIDIYNKIKDFNSDIKEQYFLRYDNNYFLYPVKLNDIISDKGRDRIQQLNNYKVIIKGKGKAKTKERNINILNTEKILNFNIENKDIYDNIYILILNIIMKEYINFENEEEIEIKKMVSLFYFLYNRIKTDYTKFFITAGGCDYRKNINLYWIYKYIITILEYDEEDMIDEIDEYLIKIVDDYIINDDDEKFIFKYNNKIYKHTIKYDGMPRLIISKLNKVSKLYDKFDYYELLTQTRSDLERQEKEYFKDDGFIYTNYYDFIDYRYRMPFELWEKITGNLSDYNQRELQLFYNEFVEGKINIRGYIDSIIDEKTDGGEYTALFNDENDEINYILLDSINEYLNNSSFDRIDLNDF